MRPSDEELKKILASEDLFWQAVEGLKARRHAAQQMLAALKRLDIWAYQMGGWEFSVWKDASAAIKLAEEAGITTGEDEHD